MALGVWIVSRVDLKKWKAVFNARAIDFAKFGRLFLHEGNWDGLQVILDEWVVQSRCEDPTMDLNGYYRDLEVHEHLDGYYKYMRWGLPRNEGEYDFSAVGNHGQYIYISPQAELIIVRNGERFGIEYDEWLHILYRFGSEDE